MIKSCVSCHRRDQADWAPAAVDCYLQLVDCINGNCAVSARVLSALSSRYAVFAVDSRQSTDSTLPQNGSATTL